MAQNVCPLRLREKRVSMNSWKAKCNRARGKDPLPSNRTTAGLRTGRNGRHTTFHNAGFLECGLESDSFWDLTCCSSSLTFPKVHTREKSAVIPKFLNIWSCNYNVFQKISRPFFPRLQCWWSNPGPVTTWQPVSTEPHPAQAALTKCKLTLH